jgi:adenylate kinase family enzyme
MKPLAELLRPRSIEEVVGQAHLLNEGKPLQQALRAGRVLPMLLWGPPGVGKTTLARLFAQECGCECIALSAVLTSVADIRTPLERATQSSALAKRTILFVDEIHRCSPQQQQALLPATQSAYIILVGATTENPSFVLKPALLSRLKVHVLKPLDDRDMRVLIDRTLARALLHIRLDAGALGTLIGLADGDAGRCAVLAVPHARRRDRSKIPHTTHAEYGLGRYRPGRSWCCPDCPQRCRGLRAIGPGAGLPGAGAGCHLPGGGRQKQRRRKCFRRSDGIRQKHRIPAGAATPAPSVSGSAHAGRRSLVPRRSCRCAMVSASATWSGAGDRKKDSRAFRRGSLKSIPENYS